MSNIKISFGELSDTIQAQLNSQGLSLGIANAIRLQNMAKSITDLFIFGLITPIQADAARKKLMKRIIESAAPIEESEE